MKKEKLGQEPAFPFRDDYESSDHVFDGMSKRFYAACAAMRGMIQSGAFNVYSDQKKGIETAFTWADELLKQESE